VPLTNGEILDKVRRNLKREEEALTIDLNDSHRKAAYAVFGAERAVHTTANLKAQGGLEAVHKALQLIDDVEEDFA
jgi:hypothetical protein